MVRGKFYKNSSIRFDKQRGNIMTSNVNAEIISIGTEILLGEITDTNSVYIARKLRDVGVNVFYMTSVGDNQTRIANAIRLAMSRSDVVITCGGLGPTVDDMTRQAVAEATERGLIFQQHLLDQISSRFNNFRVQMTENNRRQAFIPAAAIIIENPVGTAPSFAVEYNNSIVISLPGVPREMQYLLKERVIPFLREKYDLGIIKARVLKTAGIGESSLDDLIGTELLEASNPTVGLAAHNGQVDIRITAKADTIETAEEMIGRVEGQLRERVDKYIFGYDSDRLEDVLMRTLDTQGATIAVSETGMQGTITAMLGARENAVVRTYLTPDELKQTLNITDTSGNRELAVKAAQALQQETGATIVVVIVSEPDIDESIDSNETTSVVVMSGDKMRQRSYGFGAKSDLARGWVSLWSMASAWWILRDAG